MGTVFILFDDECFDLFASVCRELGHEGLALIG